MATTNNCIIVSLSLKVYCSHIDLRSPVVKLAPLLGVRLCIAARPAGLYRSNWQYPRVRLGEIQAKI